MHLVELPTLQGWMGLRYLSPLVLLWLAFLFGRTLRPGITPLIERVARQRRVILSVPLCRYTRRLTAIWCGYFLGASALSAIVGVSGGVSYNGMGLAVLAGSVLLFVGEHRLRQRFFPDETFPGLVQQLRDTWIIWRAPDDAHTDSRR